MNAARGDVLDFWFAGAVHSADALRARNRVWFAKDPAFDRSITERFGALVEAARQGELDQWTQTPSGMLALSILLDQFPRNLYRDDARAFAGDEKAQAIAVAAIARGDDRSLPPVERVFCYLPLEHAEHIGLQDRCVALFEGLLAHASMDMHDSFENFLDYARKHREVIARFGRFPHRNAALARKSTPDELEYLAKPGTTF
ncbi:MAG: DUF924 family protein [Rhodanobacteraceae bacterium]